MFQFICYDYDCMTLVFVFSMRIVPNSSRIHRKADTGTCLDARTVHRKFFSLSSFILPIDSAADRYRILEIIH